jgi:hypothetical protein
MSSVRSVWSSVFGPAVRRRPLSLACATVLATWSASLLGVPVPFALATWPLAGLVVVRVWSVVEKRLLLWRGVRPPDRLEHALLSTILGHAPVEILVLNASDPMLVRGYRHLVISRGLLDLVTSRSLLGLVRQATQPAWSASLVGEAFVWLAVWPLLLGQLVGRWCVLLGRGLAVLVGWSLVLPMLICPDAFVRWVGRLFGVGLAFCVGGLLLESGLVAPGTLLWLGWPIVASLRWLLDWEWRRTERLADQATVELGLGWQLLEGLEELGWTDEPPAPGGLVGLLFRTGAPTSDRAARVWDSFRQA